MGQVKSASNTLKTHETCKIGKLQANKVHGYRLNYFTAADFTHKRFAAMEVVPSSPLP